MTLGFHRSRHSPLPFVAWPRVAKTREREREREKDQTKANKRKENGIAYVHRKRSRRSRRKRIVKIILESKNRVLSLLFLSPVRRCLAIHFAGSGPSPSLFPFGALSNGERRQNALHIYIYIFIIYSL